MRPADAEGRTANGKTLGFDLDTGTAWKSTKGAVFENKYVSGAVNILGAIVMIAFPPSTAVMLPLLAVYNEVSNIDALVNELAAGTLTGTKLAVHAGQLMLDVLPFVGETAAIRGSALRMLTFKGATLGGMGLLMTTQVIGQIAAIRDGQIAQMAKVYEAYLALGAQTHESDPELAGKRAALMEQLDTDGQALRDVSMQVWQDAVVNLAAVVIPVHLAQGVNMHLGLRRVNALTSAGRFQHAPGVEPHYNAELGMIVGDQGKLSLPMIDQLAGVQEQHWRTVGTQLGAELGLPTDAVRLRPGTATRAWLEGDIVQAEFAPGTAPAAAKATWKQQVAAEHAGATSLRPVVEAVAPAAAPGVAPKAPEAAARAATSETATVKTADGEGAAKATVAQDVTVVRNPDNSVGTAAHKPTEKAADNGSQPKAADAETATPARSAIDTQPALHEVSAERAAELRAVLPAELQRLRIVENQALDGKDAQVRYRNGEIVFRSVQTLEFDS